MRLLVGLLALSFIASSQSANFFIQGADPQFGMYAKDANFTQETANFEFFVANVNRLKPKSVVVAGDLINRPHDDAQIAEYHRIAKKLTVPLYSVAGNHDVGNEPDPASLAQYRKDFGPDWYSFKADGIYGIVLNSSVIAFPAKVEDDAAKQETWLRAELQKAKADTAREIVIFQHIPWFLEKPDEPNQYFNITKPTRAKYLKLLHEYGVRHVFAGHYHRNSIGRDGDLEMVVTGPIGMPIGPDPSGFRIVRNFESTYYGLGNIPNQFPPVK